MHPGTVTSVMNVVFFCHATGITSISMAATESEYFNQFVTCDCVTDHRCAEAADVCGCLQEPAGVVAGRD